MKINSICIFASSSNDINEIYFKSAHELGVEIAKNNFNIVYGGSNLGLMGEVTNSAYKYGAKITGVMPEKLYNLVQDKGNCSKIIVTKEMRERKAKRDELSQAIIALAGGFGTLEELSEMIVQKQLGYNNKPIVILNTNGYYNDLINFFEKIIENNFAPIETRFLYKVAQTPKDAIDYIINYEDKTYNILDNKLKIKN